MFIELLTFYKFQILSTCKNKLDYISCILDLDVLVLLTLLPRHDTIVNTEYGK
jgi:hypothetical protein